MPTYQHICHKLYSQLRVIIVQCSKIMAKRGCDMFCFGDCQNKYEKYVVRKEQEEQVQKVSLKKVGSVSHNRGLQKIKSVSRIQNPKSLTDRSSESIKDELHMARKRMQLQKELEMVNSSITEISSQYKSKLDMLESIKKEMDVVMRNTSRQR